MFYVVAALLVAAALAAVILPSTRSVMLALLVGDLLVGVLLITAGAYLLGVVALIVPAGCLVGVAYLLHRAGYAPLLLGVRGWSRAWPLAVAAATGVGVLLVWTTASSVDDAASTSGQASLLTLLHYRTPISLGVLVVLAVLAVGGALLIGRVGDDERELDRASEQRRLRDERTRRRRADRSAARVRRPAGSDSGATP